MSADRATPAASPTYVVQPWSDLVGNGTLSDGDHQDHLHAGWRQASDQRPRHPTSG